jgi:hypothetical protein
MFSRGERGKFEKVFISAGDRTGNKKEESWRQTSSNGKRYKNA